MITLNYQTFGKSGFQLRLRLYLNGETKFVNVTRNLKGTIKKAHWNAKKQCFVPSCPYSKENNEFLVCFRQKYDLAAIEWSGSLSGFMMFVEERGKNEKKAVTLPEFIDSVVAEMKTHRHDDGTIKGGYENYEKLKKRLGEYCLLHHIRYNELAISEVNPVFVNGVFDWINGPKKGKGAGYVSASLHSVLARADKAGYLNMSDFAKCKWSNKNHVSSQKYYTLTPEQCKRFATMDLRDFPSNPRMLLYRDFCLFILYTGQSVCDAASLKYSDIQKIDGVEHFVFKRRKIKDKQALPCMVPINPVMKKIMKRQSVLSKDGYIFPIRTKKKIATQKTNNGDIKHFISRLNIWLKKVGKMLGCDFPLHTYTFRHTAITHYISKNVPVVYVANLMGTSVKNCESIYYNNMGDSTSRDKVLKAIDF